jgi:hypothetical protein
LFAQRKGLLLQLLRMPSDAGATAALRFLAIVRLYTVVIIFSGALVVYMALIIATTAKVPGHFQNAHPFLAPVLSSSIANASCFMPLIFQGKLSQTPGSINGITNPDGMGSFVRRFTYPHKAREKTCVSV